MVNIIKQEIELETTLKNKIEFMQNISKQDKIAEQRKEIKKLEQEISR